jgi:hypothetical protein
MDLCVSFLIMPKAFPPLCLCDSVVNPKIVEWLLVDWRIEN